MKIFFKPLVLISVFFFTISIFNPIHVKPLTSFNTEYLLFSSFLFIYLSTLLYRNNIHIPYGALILILIIIFNLNDLFFIFYFDSTKFYFSTIYLFFLFLSITIAYSYTEYVEKKFLILYFFVFVSFILNVFAIMQWLNLVPKESIIMPLAGGRPYANFAQPNHLATFLFLSFISLYYLFEKEKIQPILCLVIALFLMWGIVLTQSRTAWLVIFFIPIFLLFKSKKISLKISKFQLVGVFSLFWLMVIALPYVNQFLAPYFNIAQTSTLIERATTGHLRLNIWNQMIHAILEKPWFGYGWGQTTAAQYAVIDRYPGTEWASSAHNILLDILVWCGIPLGLAIIGYFAYLYFSFFFKSKSLETVCATLMISAVLIHAMLEYPLHYAYFLLPVGFLCGICLAEQNVKTFEISNKWGYLVVITGFGLLYQVFKEYDQITDNMVAANTHEMNEFKTELILPYDSIFFDKFEDRAKWIAQYPYMKVDQKALDLAERNLNSYLTSYDLLKYATLLAHNGYKEKAKRQLKILKIMYNENVTYESLFIKKPSVNVPLENSVLN